MTTERNHPRKDVTKYSEYLRYRKRGYFVIFDTDLDKPIGHLADISLSGMKVTATMPLETDTTMNLVLILPEILLDRDYITMSANCVWCKQDGGAEEHVAGFHFVSMNSRDKEMVDHLIKRIGKAATVPLPNHQELV